MVQLPRLLSLSLVSFLPFSSSLLSQERLGFQSAGDAALSRYETAVSTLQTRFFNSTSGTWPSGIDWTRAVLGTHLAASTSTLTKPNVALANAFFDELVLFFHGQDVASLETQAYDDILWVSLNWLEAVQAIDHRLSLGVYYGSQWRQAFANRAKEFWEFGNKGWDENLCDGGMVWSPWLEPYKNAITNELYIAASISMYLHHPYPPNNRTYLKEALRAHSWLKGSNMTDVVGLYTDGFHISNLNSGGSECDKRDEQVYTYNQGVILTGLRGLAEATGNETYLAEGLALVDDVLRSEGTVGELMIDGILTEKCDPGSYCSQNGQTFKGIYMHHLTAFCQPLPNIGIPPGTVRAHEITCGQYATLIRRNIDAAWKTRNSAGVMGSWWGVPSGLVSSPLKNHDTRPPGTLDVLNMCAHVYSAEQCEHAQSGGIRSSGDLNDRGRGRTVESHSGGVAALRAALQVPGVLL